MYVLFNPSKYLKEAFVQHEIHFQLKWMPTFASIIGFHKAKGSGNSTTFEKKNNKLLKKKLKRTFDVLVTFDSSMCGSCNQIFKWTSLAIPSPNYFYFYTNLTSEDWLIGGERERRSIYLQLFYLLCTLNICVSCSRCTPLWQSWGAFFTGILTLYGVLVKRIEYYDF